MGYGWSLLGWALRPMGLLWEKKFFLILTRSIAAWACIFYLACCCVLNSLLVLTVTSQCLDLFLQCHGLEARL